MTLLAVSGLVSGYRLGTVVNDVDLELEEGGAVTVLGRNGVGKSTLMNTIMGLVRARSGSVKVDGRELARKRTDVVARAGVALVPQGRRVFGPLTVREHLRLCAAYCRRSGPWSSERILELFPRLGERMDHAARQLSGGEQQMLAVSRALMTNPRLILLDEPSDGLAPAVVRQIEEVLGQIRHEGDRASSSSSRICGSHSPPPTRSGSWRRAASSTPPPSTSSGATGTPATRLLGVG